MKLLVKSILFVFLTLMLIQTVSAQSIVWQKRFDLFGHYESGRAVSSSSDSCFFVGGLHYEGPVTHGFVMKINNYGKLIWKTSILNDSIYNVECIAATNEGGCVISGRGTRNFAIRISNDGNILWKKNYGDFLTNYSILRNDKSNYVMCGSNNNDNGFITCIDSVGNFVWQTQCDTSSYITLRSVLIALDDGYIVVGSNITKRKVLILKLGESGEIQWQRLLNVLNNTATVESGDNLENGYLIGGTAVDSLHDICYFIKVDIEGNLVYERPFPTQEVEYFYDLKVINENRYVMTVTTDFKKVAKCYILDSTGNTIADNSFPNDYSSILRKSLPIDNGDILFAGIYEFGKFFYQHDVYCIRTDSLLNTKPLSISGNSNLLPQNFELHQNYPNPFNPLTNLSFGIPKSGFVSLKIYNLLGQEVASLVNENKSPGNYEVQFDARYGQAGNSGSGIYFYSLEVDGKVVGVRKMVLLK